MERISAGRTMLTLEANGADLKLVADEVRHRMLRLCIDSGTGHVGGCSAAVELLTAMYFGGILRYDRGDPSHPLRDRILIRGHLGPVRYAIFSLLGWVSRNELARYATLHSRLQGHETPDLPGVDIGPSGSLGMLLSYGVGAAVASARQRTGSRTYVFLGDGEEQEGNVAEAARHAVAAGVVNLVAIIDANGKQLCGPTAEADRAVVADVWQAYGWRVLKLANGNDVLAVQETLLQAAELAALGPVVVVADTVKGVGVAGAETHFSGYHELSHSGPAAIESALAEVIEADAIEFSQRSRTVDLPSTDQRDGNKNLAVDPDQAWPAEPDSFQLAYFERLAKACEGSASRVYFLYADTFPTPLLERTGLGRAAWCSNVGIREQHLVAMAHGISCTDLEAKVIAHTGDPFLLRAADQLHAALSAGSRFVLIGDDAGITNCRNGASHQSAMQPRFMSSLPALRMREPADGTDFALVMNEALSAGEGVFYVRIHDAAPAAAIDLTSSSRTQTWYPVLGEAHPAVVILASGFVVGEAIAAANLIRGQGIAVEVINVIDPKTAGVAAVSMTSICQHLLTVYDGHPDTLADPVRKEIVSSGLSVTLRSLGFSSGTSGRKDELLKFIGLDADAIREAVLGMVSPLAGTHLREGERES